MLGVCKPRFYKDSRARKISGSGSRLVLGRRLVKFGVIYEVAEERGRREGGRVLRCGGRVVFGGGGKNHESL